MIDCAIIGGGIAGLTAGVSLATTGKRVSIFEARSHAGGRAYSFSDRRTDSELDNGQHLLMGCYSSMMEFLRIIGTSDKLIRINRLRIPFYHINGKKAALQAGLLPYPLSIALAFLSYRMLSTQERISVLRSASGLRSINQTDLKSLDEVTVETWLKNHRQEDNSREMFWRPLVLATMNSDTHNASAKLFVNVVREIFMRGRIGSQVIIPATGLSQLYVNDSLRTIQEYGGDVCLHAPISKVQIESDSFISLSLINGSDTFARSVIFAVPPWDLIPILERSNICHGITKNLMEFKSSGIISFHVWTNKKIANEAMIGLLGTNLQWIFPKEENSDGYWRSSCTISAASEFMMKSPRELKEIVRDELCRLFPALKYEHIMRIQSIKERCATFIPEPDLERYRPDNRTDVSNLFLAGDWTNTGFPGTLEGAVRSGFKTAYLVRDYLDSNV